MLSLSLYYHIQSSNTQTRRRAVKIFLYKSSSLCLLLAFLQQRYESRNEVAQRDTCKYGRAHEHGDRKRGVHAVAELIVRLHADDDTVDDDERQKSHDRRQLSLS